MKNIINSTAAGVAAGSLIAVLAMGSVTAHAKGIVAAANGGYVATYLGSTREVGFTAKTDKKGNTRGQLQLTNLDNGVSLHFNVDCLSVDGNVATISGMIVDRDLQIVDGDPLPYFWVRVWDYGESEIPQDTVSYVVTHDTEQTCEEDFLFGSGFNLGTLQILIDEGNIQVGQSNNIEIP